MQSFFLPFYPKMTEEATVKQKIKTSAEGRGSKYTKLPRLSMRKIHHTDSRFLVTETHPKGTLSGDRTLVFQVRGQQTWSVKHPIGDIWDYTLCVNKCPAVAAQRQTQAMCKQVGVAINKIK